MKRKTRNKLITAVCVILALVIAAGVVWYRAANVLTYDYGRLVEAARRGYEEGTPFTPVISFRSNTPEPMARGFVLASPNGVIELYYDEKTSNVAVWDSRNGTSWYAVPPEAESDALASAKEKDFMRSPLRLYYYDENRKEYNYDGYSKSVALGQFAAENITGGIRVTYVVGDMSLGVDIIPEYLSPARMREVMARITELEASEQAKVDSGELKRMKYPAGWAKYFRERYTPAKRDVAEDEFYKLAAETRDVSKKATNERLVYFLENIGYSVEELAEDNEAADFEMDLQRVSFTVPVEYRISGDELVVTVPLDRVIEPPEAKISQIEILRMFGAAGTGDTGYILVPSGSGGLINFNNGKSREDAYSQIVYGIDPLMDSGMRTQVVDPVRVPYYGIYKQGASDGGFIALMTKGESMATIRGETSGRLNSYNYAYPTYLIRNYQRLYMSGVSGSESDLTVVEQNRYQGDIEVSLLFLAGEADYSAMAARLRQKLAADGILTLLEPKGGAPFYLDIIGAVEKQAYVLGVPYDSFAVMTTYKQAVEILDELGALGVRGVNARLMGWFNGGIYNETTKSVKLIGALGNKGDLRALESALIGGGGALFPDVMIVRAPGINPPISYSTRNEASRSPAGQNFRIAEFDPASGSMTSYYDRQIFFINSPRAIPSQVGKFISAYSKKAGAAGLSLNDMGDLLSGDMYKQTYVPREGAKLVYEEQLGRLSENLSLLIRGGNFYSLRYTQNVIELPISGNSYYILDADVPFLPMLLHGYADYAGQAVNDQDIYDSRASLLKMLETGAAPRYVMTYRRTDEMRFTPGERYGSTWYKTWVNAAAETYAAYSEFYDSARTAEIVKHEKLSNGVYRTTFSNGQTVKVDYNTGEYEFGRVK